MVLIRKKKKKSPEELEAERQEAELRKSGIQDEFQAKGFELAQWAQDHKIRISIGLSVLAIGLTLWVGFSYFSDGEISKANADYAAALSMLPDAQTAQNDKEKKELEARAALERVAEQYKGSKIAKLANLHVGKLALAQGDSKLAVVAFEKAVANSSTDDPMRVVGRLGLAGALEASSEKKKAFEIYESLLAETVNIDEPMLLWQAQRLAKETGDEAKSVAFAAKLAERYPSSSYASQAR